MSFYIDQWLEPVLDSTLQYIVLGIIMSMIPYVGFTNLCVCDFWLSPQSAKSLVRPLKFVNYVLMNDLTQWHCEYCSRQRLLNTFTVKLTKHTVNLFESIRSRWCLVTEDGFSSDISPQGTVTPHHLSHILDWLVNRSAAAVCTCGCTTAGDFIEIFVCCWIKIVQSSHGSVFAPLTSHWLLCFNRQTCCPALTTGLPLAVKLMLPVFKYFVLLILGGLRQAVSIPSHFISRERERILLVFFFFFFCICEKYYCLLCPLKLSPILFF